MSKVAKTRKNRCVVCGSWIQRDALLCGSCLDSVVMVTVREYEGDPYGDGLAEDGWRAGGAER
jgi:hypothetical protein